MLGVPHKQLISPKSLDMISTLYLKVTRDHGIGDKYLYHNSTLESNNGKKKTCSQEHIGHLSSMDVKVTPRSETIQAGTNKSLKYEMFSFFAFVLINDTKWST